MEEIGRLTSPLASQDASGNAGLGHVWALSLCIRLLTLSLDGTDDAEAAALLRSLARSSGGTGLMHESYWYADPSWFTRSWFAMANSYLGEALLTLAERRPALLFADPEHP